VGDGIPLGRIAGIRVAASWTLLIVVALLVLGLAGGVFPRDYPGLAAGWYLAAAAVGAALFLVSLLAHELAHALVARRAGIAVESITFWLFGGVARLSGDAGNPTAALWIALVGPLTSLALAGVFWAAASGLRGAEAAPVVAGVPGWLAWTNLGLALFNLLPGAPLDGGRVLRALLWLRSGDRDRSARTAARAGRVLGVILVGLGIFQIFSGLGANGLWIAFLGWFLGGAARAEEELATARGTLAGVRVRDAMTPDPVAAPASATVAQVLAEMTTRLRFTSLPLLDDPGGAGRAGDAAPPARGAAGAAGHHPGGRRRLPPRGPGDRLARRAPGRPARAPVRRRGPAGPGAGRRAPGRDRVAGRHHAGPGRRRPAAGWRPTMR
jgi:Zn-dependent protease